MKEQTLIIPVSDELLQAMSAAMGSVTAAWEAIAAAIGPIIEETLRVARRFQYQMSLPHNPHKQAKRRRARRQWRR